MRIKANLLLLVTAIVWGSAFVVQRIAAAQVGIFFFNGLRFLLGGLVLIPLVRLPWRDLHRSNLPGIFAAGFLLFVAGGFQQAGLMSTTAGNAAFITGLYVVFIPLALLIFWREPIRLATWLAALLAAGGVMLLSAQGRLRLAPGDGLELVGAVMWAFHVIVVGKMVRRVDVLQFSVGQFLVAGLLNTLVGLFLEPGAIPAIAASWWTVAYTGILSVGVGYTLQAVGQKHAPATDASIILSMEAVFAALSGYLFLSEKLKLIQLAGCALILAAILLVVLKGSAEPDLASQIE